MVDTDPCQAAWLCCSQWPTGLMYSLVTLYKSCSVYSPISPAHLSPACKAKEVLERVVLQG